MSKFNITRTASVDRFDKSAAADDFDVVTFIVAEVSKIDSKFNQGNKEDQVRVDVVNHSKREVFRDALVWGALARQMAHATPGSMLNGRMKKGNAQSGMNAPIILEQDGLDAATVASLEGFYGVNVESTEDGYRLRDDVTIDVAPDVNDDEPF